MDALRNSVIVCLFTCIVCYDKVVVNIRPVSQCWLRAHAWRVLSILSKWSVRIYELFIISLCLYLTKILSLVTLTCIYVKIYPLSLWPSQALTKRMEIRRKHSRVRPGFFVPNLLAENSVGNEMLRRVSVPVYDGRRCICDVKTVSFII